MAKQTKTPAAQVVTGNRLRDGAVIYLGNADGWTTEIDRSVVARDAEAAERLTAVAARAAADRIVVAPYLIEVAAEGGRIQPTSFRERIRAFGPSISERPSHRLSAA